MSAEQIRTEQLLLALRDHAIHEEVVGVRVTLVKPERSSANQNPWLVEVVRRSDGVVAMEGQGLSLDIAASGILRKCNEQRDAKVLELRRQVAKLTGNPEVGS